mgnify:CR=1 FL=1
MVSTESKAPDSSFLPGSDDCNYYIVFPKFKVITCDQQNRIAYFDPEKTNKRVRVVEYAMLIGDIREGTKNYSSALISLISMSALIFSLIVIFSYGFDNLPMATKFISYTVIGVVLLLLNISIYLYIRKCYRAKISSILKDYNEKSFHRRALHWNTDFEDQGFLHLHLNYNPHSGKFVSLDELTLRASDTFCLEMDGNELMFSDGRLSDNEANSLKWSLLARSQRLKNRLST